MRGVGEQNSYALTPLYPHPLPLHPTSPKVPSNSSHRETTIDILPALKGQKFWVQTTAAGIPVLHYLAQQTMPCLLELLYQKAVLTGRGFQPNFSVTKVQAVWARATQNQTEPAPEINC